jgi:hypothetical protein
VSILQHPELLEEPPSRPGGRPARAEVLPSEPAEVEDRIKHLIINIPPDFPGPLVPEREQLSARLRDYGGTSALRRVTLRPDSAGLDGLFAIFAASFRISRRSA